MAQPAKKQTEKQVENLFKQVTVLDDDALWMFVCKLFPDAGEDFLEDAFDSLTIWRARFEPSRPLDEVLSDLDKRHGIAR